jgi:adenylate kinase
LVILLFGPPGCGKGTQGQLILEWLPVRIPSISTGEMLRAEIAAGTPLGLKTQSIIAAGGLVDDDLINRILCARISRPDCQNGFMLDGYPRTVEQAEYLDHLLAERGMPPPVVIHLDVHAEVLVGRMVSRRHCSKCGRMYNVLSMKPRVDGICDDDGSPLVTRADDKAEVIRDRLRNYEAITRPVLSHYPHDRYFQIPGERSSHYVFEEITEILERVMAEEAVLTRQSAPQTV